MIKKVIMCTALLVVANHSFSQRRQNITLNVLGTTPIVGIKYDTRLFKAQNHGLGAHIGVGSLGIAEDDHKASATIGPNYLFGKGSHQFLLGGSAVFVFSRSYPLESDPKNSLRTMFIPDIGYRFTPKNNGFTGQLTWNPLRSNLDRESAYHYFGIGLGYTWK